METRLPYVGRLCDQGYWSSPSTSLRFGRHEVRPRPARDHLELWMLPHDRSLTVRGHPDLVQEIQDHHARCDLDDGDELLELVPRGAPLMSQVVAGLYSPARLSLNIRNEHGHRLLVSPIN